MFNGLRTLRAGAILAAAAAVFALASAGPAAAAPMEGRSASVTTERTANEIAARSAVGYQLFGNGCATFAGVRVCWPGGVLGHTIKGSGRTVTNEEMSVEDLAGAGVVGGVYCNWRLSVLYYDTAGRQYYKRIGTTHSKCTNAASPPIGQKFPTDIRLAHTGKACAVFEANGKIMARQCHNITN